MKATKRSKVVLGLSALTDTVYAGRLNKSGKMWRSDDQHDVTSDFLRVVIEWCGVGKRRTINVGGEPKYSVSVTRISTKKSKNEESK
jgi:hypothetical protein